MKERTGEAFELGEQLTVLGERLVVGDMAPAFTLDWLDPAAGEISQVRLGDSAGSERLLNVINSIDTPVCRIETQSWEQRLPERIGATDVRIFTVTMDLPFALGRWESAGHGGRVGHQLLSGHRSEDFGRDYGVLIKEWRLLQRAVFVIDEQDRIAYAEYVADQMHEPNYAAAIGAIETVAAA